MSASSSITLPLVLVAIFTSYIAVLYSAGQKNTQQTLSSTQQTLNPTGTDTPSFTLSDLFKERQAPDASLQADHEVQLYSLLESRPDDVDLNAELAESLLESGYASRPPSQDRLEQGRRRAQHVMKLLPKSASAMRANLLLLLAEGKPEDSLGPASKLIEVAPSAESHKVAGHAYLAATCSRACAARRAEQVGRFAPEGAVFAKGKEPSALASSYRAAGMWRIMEGGRTFAAGAAREPKNPEAQARSDVTEKFRNLNAFQVSTTTALMELADCAMYEGLKLDGKRCPAEGEDPYTKKKKKGSKKSKAS